MAQRAHNYFLSMMLLNQSTAQTALNEATTAATDAAAAQTAANSANTAATSVSSAANYIENNMLSTSGGIVQDSNGTALSSKQLGRPKPPLIRRPITLPTIRRWQSIRRLLGLPSIQLGQQRCQQYRANNNKHRRPERRHLHHRVDIHGQHQRESGFEYDLHRCNQRAWRRTRVHDIGKDYYYKTILPHLAPTM